MRGLRHISLLLAATLAFCSSASAGERYLGSFQSPKGLGASLLFGSSSDNCFNVINLYADMFGVFSGRTRDVGAVLSYSRDYVIISEDYEFCSVTLHGGPGFLTGYVHDYERHYFTSEGSTDKNMGFVAALSGNIGLLTDFYSHRISIDIVFRIDPGMHIRRDSGDGAVLLSLYKRGIYYSLCPQLCIYYRF